jgi:alkanesulfonate monooxygenase SsuD/methylene tetrahydromethanopterin reductase-like flavin-dependent oxidoreductase (luciferase family)
LTACFAARSVSLGIYAGELPANAQIEDLLAQAALAERAGFDGVTVSEHHAGFPGYLPNPVLVVSWLLRELVESWCAPCPMLLAARPAVHVIEDLAWVAARHPGRLGAAFTPGYVGEDFAAPGLDFAQRRARFHRDLPVVVDALRGNPPQELVNDRALKLCTQRPVGVLATAETAAGADRAAHAGAGILMAAHNSLSAARKVFDAYADAGGRGPRVLIRRVHIGALPPAAREGLVDLYRRQGGNEEDVQLVNETDPADVGRGLAGILRASGATALNLRVNLRGMTAQDTRNQITLLAGALTAFRSEIDVQDEGLV